jgi:Family of unknown function (DUF6167)
MDIMSRVVWFAAGAVSGVYTLVKAKRTAQNLTPDGIGARVAALGLGARMFAGEVASAMSTREAELRAELSMPSSSRRALEPLMHQPDDQTPGVEASLDPAGISTSNTSITSNLPTTPRTDGEGRHDGHR